MSVKSSRPACAEMFGPTVGDRARLADTVIANALILDHWGIVKADIVIKCGYIAGE